MTVSAAYTPAVYTANGTANQFNFGFSALRTQDVWLVEHDKDTGEVVREFQGGSGLTVSLGSGFVIIDDYDQRPLAGNKVTVYRRTQATQTVDLDSTVPVSSDAVEGMSDKLTLLAQEAQNFGDDYTDLQQSIAEALAAQLAAEDARDDAVIAQGAAESARDLAIGAKNDAENAQGAAESARDLAIGAKNDAENAQGAAESARDLAIGAKDDAEDARDAAALSASDAFISEGNAANSAQAASDDADAAEQARDEIEALYIGVYADDAAANAAHPTRPVGALYFSSNSDNLRLWNGTAWEVVATPSGNFLLRDGSSPMTGPLLAAVGSAAVPGVAFDGDSNTGLYRMAVGGEDYLGISTGGATRATISSDSARFLSPVRVPNGTVSVPAFAFDNDPNTGLYRAAPDVLGISTGGVLLATIGSSGLSLSARLLVGDGTADSPVFAFANDSDTGIYRPSNNQIGFAAAGARAFLMGASWFLPWEDNAKTLGGSGNRWSTVYAATGTINTSDAREKTPVEPMSSAEIEAAKGLAREIGTFRWLASIESKGDNARFHVGLTVQRAIEIMESHDLDPFSYGFMCFDEWEADEDREAGDRYSFRVDQLNLFIARGLEARITALEAALL